MYQKLLRNIDHNVLVLLFIFSYPFWQACSVLLQQGVSFSVILIVITLSGSLAIISGTFAARFLTGAGSIIIVRRLIALLAACLLGWLASDLIIHLIQAEYSLLNRLAATGALLVVSVGIFFLTRKINHSFTRYSIFSLLLLMIPVLYVLSVKAGGFFYIVQQASGLHQGTGTFTRSNNGFLLQLHPLRDASGKIKATEFEVQVPAEARVGSRGPGPDVRRQQQQAGNNQAQAQEDYLALGWYPVTEQNMTIKIPLQAHGVNTGALNAGSKPVKVSFKGKDEKGQEIISRTELYFKTDEVSLLNGNVMSQFGILFFFLFTLGVFQAGRTGTESGMKWSYVAAGIPAILFVAFSVVIITTAVLILVPSVHFLNPGAWDFLSTIAAPGSWISLGASLLLIFCTLLLGSNLFSYMLIKDHNT